MKKGLCHMNIELTLGVPPDGAYELFINPTNIPFFVIDKSGRQLLVFFLSLYDSNVVLIIAILESVICFL